VDRLESRDVGVAAGVIGQHLGAENNGSAVRAQTRWLEAQSE
jgi:hypothetical protein